MFGVALYLAGCGHLREPEVDLFRDFPRFDDLEKDATLACRTSIALQVGMERK